jgi:hypothetical protein
MSLFGSMKWVSRRLPVTTLIDRFRPLQGALSPLFVRTGDPLVTT